MTAKEFIKQYGWGYAKHILSDDSPLMLDLNYDDLKQLVDAYDLVESYGGLDMAKTRCYPAKFLDLSKHHDLKQAIALVDGVKMKIKIKSFNGELPSYLTVGKVYDVHQTVKNRVISRIRNDRGHLISINLKHGCCYLNSGSWEVVE